MPVLSCRLTCRNSGTAASSQAIEKATTAPSDKVKRPPIAALPMVPAKGNLSGWLDLNLPAAARPIHLDWLPDQRTMDEPAS